MASLACLEKLPAEIIHNILKKLGFKDLSNLSTVSRTFYHLATDPLLWKTFEHPHHTKPETLIAMLQLERLRRIEKVHLCQGFEKSGEEAETIVQMFESFQNVELKHLTIQHFDLTNLNPITLSQVLNNIENIGLNHCIKITDEQISKIIADIPEYGRMKGLQVNEIDLSRVEPKSLSQAVNSLHDFYTIDSRFSQELLEEVFARMAVNTNLKDLSLIGVEGLENILPVTLSSAFNNLEFLYIDSRLSGEQLGCFFEQLARKTTLKKLHLELSDTFSNLLSPIPSDILCKGIQKLHTMVMPYLVLRTNQMRAILEGIIDDNSNVKRLDLGDNIIPNEVCMEVLKSLMSKLQPNFFTCHHLHKKILEKDLESLNQKLKAKEAELFEKEAERVRLLQREAALKELHSVMMSALQIKNKLSNKYKEVKVQIVRKSKFSSSYRFAAKSRVAKKSNFVVKLKVLSK